MCLLLAVGLAACNPAPRAAGPNTSPVRPFPGSETVEAVLAHGWITVTLTLPLRPPGPKPVVITPIVNQRELLERGIAVARFRTHWETLAPLAGSAGPTALPTPATGAPMPPAAREMPGAGGAGGGTDGGATTVGSWLLAAPRPGIVGRGYFALITEDAAGSIPQVVDFLSTVPQIDPTRIAIAGSSTSGFVALQALAAEPRLAMGVVRVACGDYFLFLRKSRLALDDDPRWLPGGRLELDPDYEVKLRDIQPIGHADRFPPRPLLLLAGENDPGIPVDCVRRTAESLAGAYARAGVPERFRLVVFPDQGHNLGVASEREALDWWERWLLRGGLP